MGKKLKILVVSCSPWRDDNNIGGSYSNIFSGMGNIELAHICCGSGVPKTNLVKRHFHISEKLLLSNLLNSSKPAGIEFVGNNEALLPLGTKNGLFDFVRSLRFTFFFWIRDLIWFLGRAQGKDLEKFVDEFNPDIIFAPFLDTYYLNKMLLFLVKKTENPLIVYAWDDVYSYNCFSFSPFVWVNKWLQRKWLRKINKKLSRFYVISDNQKKAYSKIFYQDCQLIYKGYHFDQRPVYPKKENGVIKFVFTGNISCGRWESLSLMGQALDRINGREKKAELVIYSATPMSGKMKKALSCASINLMGSVPSSEIPKIQAEADVLVHAESFALKEHLAVRMSFSTKIVDYLAKAKCLLAIGPSDVASIDYLLKNDAACVISNKQEVKEQLQKLIESPTLLEEYGEKAWECGKRNHQIEEIQNKLYADFIKIVEEKK